MQVPVLHCSNEFRDNSIVSNIYVELVWNIMVQICELDTINSSHVSHITIGFFQSPIESHVNKHPFSQSVSVADFLNDIIGATIKCIKITIIVCAVSECLLLHVYCKCSVSRNSIIFLEFRSINC
jgi:hypothetical protein